MTDLARFQALVPLDHGLSVVVPRRADQTPHTTVVNAGVVPHPVTGGDAVAFVAAGGTLVNLSVAGHRRVTDALADGPPGA
jgi:hypothetical protein